MEIVPPDSAAFNATALKHRGSGLAFRDLFLGDEKDVTNNYYFIVARQESFYSPVHRHNFDQFRFLLRGVGPISISPDVDVHSGELCYHPEGVHYGPQEDGKGVREVLVLQFGGASGQGFLSHAQLKAGQERLGKKGRFEAGKFVPEGKGEDGAVDGFQALWEDHMGKKLVYPKERYHRPILMRPENFIWKPVKGQSGVTRKVLGVFSERETRAEVIRIEKSIWKVPAEDATQLFFVTKGRGTVDGKIFEAEAAARMRSGVEADIETDGTIELLRFVIPILSSL